MGSINAAEPAAATRLDFSRFQSWQETTFQFFSRTDCIQHEGPSFRAWMARRHFGGMVAGHAGSSPIGYVRRQGDIRHDQVDDFVIVLMRKGRLRISQGDDRAEVKPGDLVMYHQARPFEISVVDECDAVLISVPAPMITSRVDLSGMNGLRPLPARSPGARFAASVLATFGDVDQLDEMADQGRISAAALDMFAAALPKAGSDMTTAPARDLLAKVQRHIRAQLDNPDLSVASIAIGVGVSERSLNRLFAAQQTTPMRWLWHERLSHAYNALASGQAANVTDAAFAFGFKDMSHFSRAFRQRFQLPPSAVLRAGQCPPPSARVGS